MDTALLQQLKALPELEVRENEPLSRYTGFRTGGPATVLLPQSERALTDALALLREAGAPRFLLGNGSNVLARDEGYGGFAVCTGAALRALHTEGDRIYAGAGVPLAELCRAAQRSALTGLEFAYGIPGTVGGAVYMNAGAYGGEMKDAVCSVRYLDERGELRSLSGSEAQFVYRGSIFSQRKDWVILGAEFALEAGDADAIRARMEELMARRTEKQPLDKPSCGSTFKRPDGNYASKLIDECGLRGARVGGAQVSEKHCGFLVNAGGATSADILALIALVQNTVKEKTGYALECEVEILG